MTNRVVFSPDEVEITANGERLHIGADGVTIWPNLRPPEYWRDMANEMIANSIVGSKLRVDVTTPFEGTAEISIGRQEEFTPRLAHCHPSHRWTRRDDDSVELWCACGTCEKHLQTNPCSLHNALAIPTRFFWFAAEYLKVDVVMPRTERERCEWAGVEYLEIDCQGNIDSGDHEAEQAMRDCFGQWAAIVHCLFAHRGRPSSNLDCALKKHLTEDEANALNYTAPGYIPGHIPVSGDFLEEYNKHGCIVRHFGFGQNPHEDP